MRNRSRSTKLGTTRVVFLFPDSSELRYLYEPPRPGQRVESASGREWTVDQVLRSGIDSYTVTCIERHREIARVRDVATDLLEAARRSVSLADIRRKRRERDYLP